MNIDEMPAGPEMDALVAERVTGWKCTETGSCDGIMRIRCAACGGAGHGNCYGYGKDPIQIECDHRPNYSTDIAAAWEVVGKLISMNYLVRVGTANLLGPGWKAVTWKDYTSGPAAEGETAPLAICRAALKAVL